MNIKSFTISIPVVFALLIFFVVVAAPAQAADVPRSVVQAGRDAIALFEAGSAGDAAEALKAISDSPAFKTYPIDFQASILVAQGKAELRASGPEYSETSFRRAIGLGQTESLDDARVGLINTLHAYGGAGVVEEATTLLSEVGSAAGLRSLGIRTVWWVINETDTSEFRPVRTRALETLYRFNFGSDEAPGLPDYLWAELAAARVAGGNTSGAAAVRDRIVDPGALLNIETRAATRAIWAADPKSALTAKAASIVVSLKAYTAANPAKGDAAVELIMAQLLAGQHKDAVETGKAALSRGQAKPSTYDDWDDQGAWIANHLSRAYLGVKDADNAIAAMKTGASLTEGDSANVSQTINLMILYNMLGRPKDALAIAEPKDGISDYGRAEFASARVCSHAAAKDQTAAESAYSSLKAMQKKNPSAVFVAALCRNALPEATAIFLAILKDPKTSDQALSASQVNTLRWTGEYGAEIIARKRMVLSDPSVQAALKEVGRSIETGLWSDFDQF